MASTDAHTHGHDYAAANKALFDAKAAELDANPEFRALARSIAGTLLRTYPALFAPERTALLDFACGTGLVAFELAPHVRTLLGVDISDGMAARFNARAAELGLAHKARAVVAALTGAPGELDGQQFDVVLCSMAYHHLAAPADTTALLARLLRPGGTLLVLDFAARDYTQEEIPEEFRAAVAHAAGFAEDDVRAMFEGAGLEGFELREGVKMAIGGKERDIFVARGVRAPDA
ncbi:S-adenosyl-L-methionine-dependent methyltransferase [Phanerochaete sordida]|uniref:S-adenosyl-L-methionine-dependent methyltransferase n=1 Tax=Phanerochaete sordida TaxID=48140 RepID=A0A9P3GA45_9APHY|nr:S-adenosyl-L-methionine-dependent methyltransferase [Phanerochaete sordida]